METSLPLLFAAVIGFSHAFEADHLVAVGSIVTKRDNIYLALKDGIYWGLGHTSMIFLMGLVIILGKVSFLQGYFGYFEAIVGLMLIVLGIYRLYQYRLHIHKPHELFDHKKHHQLAYGVGLVHGLAGSGTLILLVMTEIQSSVHSILYLLIFGIGSVIGMFVASGIFSLPFSKKISHNQHLKLGLILLSSFICIGFGIHLMIENLG